jgi:tetratricopeptide (TPR) repeat protein
VKIEMSMKTARSVNKRTKRRASTKLASTAAALTLSVLLANTWLYCSATPAFKNWGKINLYLPNDATSEEKRIATVAAQGNPTEALALTDKAIKSEKDIARLLLIRIQLCEILLQEEKVPEDFRHLLNLPIGEDALVNAIDLADRLDEIESGIKLGDRYLKEFGTHIPQAILLTARMNSKLKRYSRAEQLLLLIINVPVMRNFTYPELARAYVCWNKPEKLIALTTTGLNNPKWFTQKTRITILTMRANAYRETGKFKESLGDYNQLIAQAPNLPEIYNLRAKTLTALRQNKLAAEDRLKQKQLDALDK